MKRSHIARRVQFGYCRTGSEKVLVKAGLSVHCRGTTANGVAKLSFQFSRVVLMILVMLAVPPCGRQHQYATNTLAGAGYAGREITGTPIIGVFCWRPPVAVPLMAWVKRICSGRKSAAARRRQTARAIYGYAYRNKSAKVRIMVGTAFVLCAGD